MAVDDLQVVHVPVGELRPNSWNPNVQTVRVSAALGESLEAYGFIDPVLVRPHPDGGFEIVDGEHRWDAAVAAGAETVAVIVRELSDDDAKKLTVILNETRGSADVVGLAQLLAELGGTMDADELIIGLPYSPDELSDLIAMADLEWNAPSSSGEGRAGARDGWSTISCRVPDAARVVIADAVSRFWRGKDIPHNEAAAYGLMLEALAADYLAGPEG